MKRRAFIGDRHRSEWSKPMAVLLLRHPVPVRIIRIATTIAVVERRTLGLGERRAEPQVLSQVRIDVYLRAHHLIV